MTWLVAIGLTNALLASLLAVGALLASWLRRPALAHLIWLLVLCKLLTPPLIKFSVEGWAKPGGWLDPATWSAADLRHAPSAAVLPAEFAEATNDEAQRAIANETHRVMASDVPSSVVSPITRWPVATAPARRSWQISPRECVEAGALIWVFGSVATLLILCRRAGRFRKFLRSSAHGDPRLNERAARLARSVGIASPPQVLLVESVVSPMLWGVGRWSRLLLPGPLVRRLDTAACDALVLHELAHYARGDGWVRLLELVVRVVYWWHPLVGWARRAIEASEEQCCDAWVLRHQSGSRRSYAEALLATIDFLCEPAPRTALALPPAASGLGALPMLRCRLTQIMCGEVVVRPSRWTRLLVMTAAAVLLPLGPAFVGGAPRAASARGTATMKVDPSHSANFAEPGEATDSRRGAAFLGRPGVDHLGRSSHNESIDSLGQMRSVSAASPTAAQPSIPQLPRLPAVLWATATSPNGKYKIEARAGRRSALVHAESGWRLDLSTYKIACLSFAPDSRTLATGHDDSIVRVWDCETGGVLYSLKGSEGPIASLAIDRDGRRLAAGAADGSVLVWDLSGGEQIARLARQEAAVSCVRWSAHGDRLAVSLGRWSDHGQASLLIWSPEEGRASSYALGEPAGAIQWLADDASLLLAGWDGRGQIWRLTDEAPSGWLTLSKDAVSAAAWSPDCPLIPSWQNEQLASGVGTEFENGME